MEIFYYECSDHLLKDEWYKRTITKDGKSWKYYKKQHPLNKSERFIRGLEATLATIFTLGFSLCIKQIRRLFKESVRGWETYKIYIKHVDHKPRIDSRVDNFFSYVITKCQTPLNATLIYEVNGEKELLIMDDQADLAQLQERLKKELESFSKVDQLELKFTLFIDQQDKILHFVTVPAQISLLNKPIFVCRDHFGSYNKADIPEMIEQKLWDLQDATILKSFLNPL